MTLLVLVLGAVSFLAIFLAFATISALHELTTRVKTLEIELERDENRA